MYELLGYALCTHSHDALIMHVAMLEECGHVVGSAAFKKGFLHPGGFAGSEM